MPSSSLKLFASLLTLAAPAVAATVSLVTDNFSDNERLTFTNGSPATSLNWSFRAGSSTGASAATGALVFTPPTSALLTTSFDTITLSPTGITSITVSFDYSASNLATLSTWRWGLLNSAGHLTTDTTGATNGASNYAGVEGYSFIGGIGTGTGASSWRFGETASAVGTDFTNSGTNPALGGSHANVALTNNTVYNGSLTLTLTETNTLSISATVAGYTLTATDATPTTLDFNGFWMLTGTSGNVMTVDNFQITGVTAVPEPSSAAALAGLAALGCLGLRRRRR